MHRRAERIRALHRVGGEWLLVAAMALGSQPAAAGDAGVTRPLDAGRDAADAAAGAALEPRIERLHALANGSLAVSVEPQSLFDVPLADEAALQVDAVRVRALLRSIDAVEPPRAPTVRTPAASAPDASSLRDDIEALDPARWAARIALDRARLGFYSIEPQRRVEILKEHSARQRAAQPKETDEERRVREAEEERQRALAASLAARTESERLVSEELARLIALDSQVGTVRERFRDAREEVSARKDTVLGLQRRVRDAKAARDSADADATYDSLRRALRASRDALSAALDVLSSDQSDVPVLGADALLEVPPDVPTDEVRARRAAIDASIREASREEHALREHRAAALIDEIATLNRERLGLLPYLSDAKRSASTGFTAAGWDQAKSEARHLSLILRYHRYVAQRWLASLRTGGPSGFSPWTAAAVAIPWLAIAAAFRWGRRRSASLLAHADTRLAESDRAERPPSPSPQRLAIGFLKRVHRPLEWGAFFVASIWLLPDGARALLEVQLLTAGIGWILGGSLVVHVINALAAGSARGGVHDEPGVGEIRLRSLRLVGRTVVVFALILVVSTRLVGEGTLYSWVFSTCWFAAVPVFLVVVRWWREVVFERMDRARKKNRLQTWILSNRRGWKSAVAVTIGALQLFGLGTIKAARGWLSNFDFARRVHAYLFKREIERRGGERPTVVLKPLHQDAWEALHPERPVGAWLVNPNDEARATLQRRVAAGHGGVVVVVGSRGMGKSTLLWALQADVEGAIRVECSATTTADVVRRAAVGGESGARPPLVLLDDAQTLVKPVIGGLGQFDQLIALARAHCATTTWVVAIDASVWPLLRRARDARPLFDETITLAPWDETQLGALLDDRDALAGIAPSYEDLLDKMPVGTDEIDRSDALKAKRAGYERMLWDHVRGNPGLALQAWRASLGVDEAGLVRVQPLQVPDSSRLDLLPDSTLFVLRAVLQLAPAAVEDVAQATRLTPDQVLNALRFGQTQGFFSEQNGRIRVTWPWLRPVVRLLERRHLLVEP